MAWSGWLLRYRSYIWGLNTGGANVWIGTESEPLCDRLLMNRQVGSKTTESTSCVGMLQVPVLWLHCWFRTVAVRLSLRRTCAPAIAFHRQPFQSGSQWVLAFVFSPLSESLSKSQIESIFVNFELCNAYHLFLLKDKKGSVIINLGNRCIITSNVLKRYNKV